MLTNTALKVSLWYSKDTNIFCQFQKPGRSFVNNEEHGLVFRSFIYLFEELQKRSEDANYVIKASYLEIYNEKVNFL